MLLDDIIAKLDEDVEKPAEAPAQEAEGKPAEHTTGYLSYGQDFLEKYPRKAPAPHL